MTVGYMKDVATANSFTFIRLLFRWRGSVWKAIYWELLIWLFFFFNIRTFYDFALFGTNAGDFFEQAVLRCRDIIDTSRTVITFALGFYVTFVTNRWWNVFMTIPWPDSIALQLTAYLRSRGRAHEAEDRSLRQTIMRYLILSYVLVFRDVSLRIRNRFPTYDHLTPTLITIEERAKLEKYDESRHWVPIEWVLALLRTANRKGSIDNFHFAEMTRAILKYRQQLHDILSYDWISVPLVYVQSVNICVLSYFVISCLASQTVYHDSSDTDAVQNEMMGTFIPVHSLIEFVVFNGWLKTAFVMLNPFGLDDDDFDMDTIIERNLMVSLSYVSDFFDNPPKLVDMTVKLPHTIESAAILKKANPMHGSAVTFQVPTLHQRVLSSTQADMMGKFLPTKVISTTNLLKTKPNPSDPPNNKQWNYVDDIESPALKGPNISTREQKADDPLGDPLPGGYILKKEDLELAVAKLLEKKLAEDLKSDKTQSIIGEEDPTQQSECEEKRKQSIEFGLGKLMMAESATNVTKRKNVSRVNSQESIQVKTRKSKSRASQSPDLTLLTKVSNLLAANHQRGRSTASTQGSTRNVPKKAATSKQPTSK